MKRNILSKFLLITSLTFMAYTIFMPYAHSGETGGFSAGDAIVRPMDLARDAAKQANDRQKKLDEVMGSGTE